MSPSEYLEKLRASGMRGMAPGGPQPSRIGETVLARALFATDPRILAIFARVDGPNATSVDVLRRAWMQEHQVREECKARAHAIFAVAGVGWDWSDYPGMRDAGRHEGDAQ